MKFRRLSRDHRLLLFSMGIAALFLLIHSKSSPLYAMNDWVDVHCFFTMGRGILDGQVPYMDLYEQKGPVLYFLFALAALIDGALLAGFVVDEVGGVDLNAGQVGGDGHGQPVLGIAHDGADGLVVDKIVVIAALELQGFILHTKITTDRLCSAEVHRCAFHAAVFTGGDGLCISNSKEGSICKMCRNL